MPKPRTEEYFALALQWHGVGRFSEAEAFYRRVLAIQPNHPGALHYLGLIACRFSRFELAIPLLERASSVSASDFAILTNLAEAYRQAGRLDEAVDACRRALALNPNIPEAYNNLGNTLKEKGQKQEAVATLRRGIEINPGLADIHKNLGNLLAEMGRIDEAITAIRHALELKPGSADIFSDLGNILAQCNRYEEAMQACRIALQLAPDHAYAHNNLGNVLREIGRLDEAVTEYRAAIALKPDSAPMYTNLANVIVHQGMVSESMALHRRALALAPNSSKTHSNLLETLHFDSHCSEEVIQLEQRQWVRQFEKPIKRSALAHRHRPDPERRLRVGYIAPDFKEHVIGRNLVPLFKHHDHHAFEIFTYSCVRKRDALTDYFEKGSDHWRDILYSSDGEVADAIKEDAIDILVDLTQHLAGNRLPVFSHCPSPVQMSFAGYPESTGLTSIGYRISDCFLESKSATHRIGTATSSDPDLLPEERILLLDSFWCYDPCGATIAANEPPAQTCGQVTFRSLNAFCKMNEDTLQLWSDVLTHTGNSRLVILTPEGSHRERVLDTFHRRGIAPNRIQFEAWRTRLEYLELYHELDIILDSYPYNGHTTNLDALWMGVPVVTKAGPRAISRAGLSQLSHLELEDLVAYSDSEYVQIAGRIAGDLSRLASLRINLRRMMQGSILMNGHNFCRGVETAYRTAWRHWCAGQ